MKSLFPKIVQMNNDNKLECNIDKEMLQRHAVTVMEGLGAAVESLDDSHFLNGVLISIGQTHVHRHVKPQMLKVGRYHRLYLFKLTSHKSEEWRRYYQTEMSRLLCYFIFIAFIVGRMFLPLALVCIKMNRASLRNIAWVTKDGSFQVWSCHMWSTEIIYLYSWVL